MAIVHRGGPLGVGLWGWALGQGRGRHGGAKCDRDRRGRSVAIAGGGGSDRPEPPESSRGKHGRDRRASLEFAGFYDSKAAVVFAPRHGPFNP